MTPSTSTNDVVQRGERSGGSLRRIADWLVAALLVLGGLVGAVGGYFLFRLADRDAIARAVAEGTIESDVLTAAELVDVTYALAWWGGVALAVTSLLILLAGVGYLLARARSRRAAAQGLATRDTGTNAVLGAVVTVVTGFVPLSPVIGGAVAGYLQRGERRSGATVGALSGLAVAVPVTVLLGVLVVGLATVSLDVVLAAGVIGLLTLLVTVLFTVALSALGGYLGVVLTERERGSSAADETA